jgi:hypothetical protein
MRSLYLAALPASAAVRLEDDEDVFAIFHLSTTVFSVPLSLLAVQLTG